MRKYRAYYHRIIFNRWFWRILELKLLQIMMQYRKWPFLDWDRVLKEYFQCVRKLEYAKKPLSFVNTRTTWTAKAITSPIFRKRAQLHSSSILYFTWALTWFSRQVYAIAIFLSRWCLLQEQAKRQHYFQIRCGLTQKTKISSKMVAVYKSLIRFLVSCVTNQVKFIT